MFGNLFNPLEPTSWFWDVGFNRLIETKWLNTGALWCNYSTVYALHEFFDWKLPARNFPFRNSPTSNLPTCNFLIFWQIFSAYHWIRWNGNTVFNCLFTIPCLNIDWLIHFLINFQRIYSNSLPILSKICSNLEKLQLVL